MHKFDPKKSGVSMTDSLPGLMIAVIAVLAVVCVFFTPLGEIMDGIVESTNAFLLKK